jgi:hypothetical protein
LTSIFDENTLLSLYLFAFLDLLHLFLLEKAGIEVWLDGGWAVDALLGMQTRPHKEPDARCKRVVNRGIAKGAVEPGADRITVCRMALVSQGRATLDGGDVGH